MNTNVVRPSGPPTLAAKRVFDPLDDETTAPLEISIERYALSDARNNRCLEEGVRLIVILLVKESDVNVRPVWALVFLTVLMIPFRPSCEHRVFRRVWGDSKKWNTPESRFCLRMCVVLYQDLRILFRDIVLSP